MASASPDARRLALDSLADMATGRLTERLRLNAAAHLLFNLRRALDLAEAGALTGPALLPPLLAGWDRAATTAREYVESLAPAQLDRLLADVPRWAAAMLRLQDSTRRAA
jgi:hypothetical protein